MWESLFHAYGLILGVAMLLGLFVCERRAVPKLIQEEFWRALIVRAFAGGLIGARAYHVLTDWQYYAGDPLLAFEVWRGGLSIIGGVVGGFIAVWWWYQASLKRQHHTSLPSWTVLLDIVALGLPVGQAFGRLGNWVNQELYGAPTKLPWGVFIDPAHRFVKYAHEAFYHPLFAYEAVPLALFATWLWHQSYQPYWTPGNGKLWRAYLAFYATLRFLLDFLRLDKRMAGSLSVNQWMMGSVMAFLLLEVAWRVVRGAQRGKKKGSGLARRTIKSKLVSLAVLFIFSALFTACQYLPGGRTSPQEGAASTAQVTQDLRGATDHQVLTILVGEQRLRVEVVNTPGSITQGLSDRTELGSDGMLFVLPEAGKPKFWMKGMNFDIDIVWLYQGKIVGVTPRVPHPAQPAVSAAELNALPRYPAPTTVDMVLELPVNRSAQLHLEVGQALQIDS